MNQEMFEILIGKYLDGEITLSEQRIFEMELERNPDCQELLRGFQDLHRSSCELVTTELLGRGETAEEIFRRAQHVRSKHPMRRIFRMGGWLRFAAGVAAGLAIGLALHFLPSNAVIPNTDNQISSDTPIIQPLQIRTADNPVRQIDWYSFTDDQGNQWLIEGLSENIVRPAVYNGGL